MDPEVIWRALYGPLRDRSGSFDIFVVAPLNLVGCLIGGRTSAPTSLALSIFAPIMLGLTREMKGKARDQPLLLKTAIVRHSSYHRSFFISHVPFSLIVLQAFLLVCLLFFFAFTSPIV